MRPPVAWIKRRARKLMLAHGIKRSKAVRYAYDDWKAFKGGRFTCWELGVCQGRGDCHCPKPVNAARSTPAMQDFYRFMSRATGDAR
ncbi:hypothetical protein [Variovorax paradoxus]|uniref:Uncharacterized protein n=1 Tax=Variovorax paradoxus TaxID=34073 RepID=A0A0H2LWX9_VARPD|nr:hypothetical protein [Variovorax paradoxus]KLN54709.1 hypothetical protein VPARA_40130 [Variovorax paradoxus]